MAQIEATLDIRQGDNLPSLPTKTSSQTQSAAEKYRLAEEIVFSQLAQKLVNVEQSYLYSGKGRDLGFDGIGFDGDGGITPIEIKYVGNARAVQMPIRHFWLG